MKLKISMVTTLIASGLLVGCADPAGPPVTKFKNYGSVAVAPNADGWYQIGNNLEYKGPILNGLPHGEGECRESKTKIVTSSYDKCSFDKGNRTDLAWVSERKKEADERKHEAWLDEQDRLRSERITAQRERESKARMWASVNSVVNQGIQNINQAQDRMSKQNTGVVGSAAYRGDQAVAYAQSNQQIDTALESNKESSRSLHVGQTQTGSDPGTRYSPYIKYTSIAPDNISVACGKIRLPDSETIEYTCEVGSWSAKSYEDISASVQRKLCTDAKVDAIKKAKELPTREPYPRAIDTPSVLGISACECQGFDGNSDSTGKYYVPEYGHRWTSCRATTLVRWDRTIKNK